MDLLERKIFDLINPLIEDLGYTIVRVKFYDASHRTLQIMAERKSDRDLSANDCAKISYEISTAMEVEDPISGEYNLEVSSPGIDRPLVRQQDFVDYADNVAKISTNFPIDGRKRYKGRLKGINDKNEVLIQLDDLKEVSVIPFEDIASAKLVLTDELVEKTQKLHKNS
jgi:ribosome maturation factor RimP